jgi:uncharacterized protein (TIGR02001 family)
MRKLLITTAALFAALSLRAEEPVSSYSITTDFTYVSEYIFRGVKQQNNSIQPSVAISAGNFSGGLWTAQAIDQKSASWAQGNEIDIYGSYSFSLSENYSLSVGGTAYLYPSARPSLGELDKTIEGSIGVSGPLGPLSAYATYFHDFDLDSDTFEIGLGYSGSFSDKSGYEFGGSYGSASFDAGGDYDYYLFKAAVTYQVTPSASLKFGLYWSDSDIAGLKSNTWFSVGITTGL